MMQGFGVRQQQQQKQLGNTPSLPMGNNSMEASSKNIHLAEKIAGSFVAPASRTEKIEITQAGQQPPDRLELISVLNKLSDEQLQQILKQLPAYQRICTHESSKKVASTHSQPPFPVENTQSNRRKAKRSKVLCSGKIIYNNKMSVNNCIIRNLSSTGCGIRIDSTTGIPNYFSLHIVSGDKKHECEVAWRTSHKIGVRFID